VFVIDGTPIDMMAHPLQEDGSPVFVLGSCSLDSVAGNGAGTTDNQSSIMAGLHI